MIPCPTYATNSTSSWRDILPYTVSYLEEAYLAGIPSDISPPMGWAITPIKLSRGVTVSSLCDIRVKHGEPEAILYTHPIRSTPIYWETRFTSYSAHPPDYLQIGFGRIEKWSPFETFRLVYDSNGYMMTSSKHHHEVLRTGEHYEVSRDIIGCGYIAPNCVFFTKNGELLDELLVDDLPLGDELCMVLSVKTNRHSDVNAWVNFGQNPFDFDMARYWGRRQYTAHTQELAWSLPSEILELFLQHTLHIVDDGLRSDDPATHKAARHVLRSMSSVSRRWRRVCARHLFSLVNVTSPADLQQIGRSRCLSTQERHNDSWLHRLLIATLPSPLIPYQEWTCSSAQMTTFMPKLPPRFSAAIHTLPRRDCHFAVLRKLTLERFNFPSWTQFARFIFAFPLLAELHLKDVSWDATREPDSPPTWLRCSHRIQSINLSGSCAEAGRGHGFLWLMTCGTRRTPLIHDFGLAMEDVTALGRLIKLLCSFSALESISYTVLDEKQCEISCRGSPSSPATLLLRLVKVESKSFNHRLVYVRTTFKAASASAARGRITAVHDLLRKVDLSNSTYYTCHLQLQDVLHRKFPLVGLAFWQLEASWTPSIGSAKEIVIEIVRPEGSPMDIDWIDRRIGRVKFPRTKPAPLWIWLHKYTDHMYGKFVASIRYRVEPSEDDDFDIVEFTLPDVSAGCYFLAVGNRMYRMEKFEVAV